MSSISRRDFLNGAALTIAAGLTPADQAVAQPARYPPALTGLRGGPRYGDEEVRRVLEQASPESVLWLASRAISYMDETGYPEAVEPWFQSLLDPHG